MKVNSSTQRISTIALALTAIVFVAGCHKKQPITPPPLPPTISTPTPTATLTAVPESIQPGQSSTLTWSTANANDVSISGVGPVKTSGSTTVSPTSTTTYTLTARGDGGSTSSIATVAVAAPPAPPPAETSGLTNDQIFHQQVPDIFFDYDSYDIRPEASAATTKAVAFLNANPGIRVLIGGYCDDRGSTEYNLALGASRAGAAKDALVRGGVNASRIRTVSFGKEKPFCTEENEACWQQNRRAAFSVDK